MPCAAMNHFPTYLRRSGGIVFVMYPCIIRVGRPDSWGTIDAGTHSLHAGPRTTWQLHSW